MTQKLQDLVMLAKGSKLLVKRLFATWGSNQGAQQVGCSQGEHVAVNSHYLGEGHRMVARGSRPLQCHKQAVHPSLHCLESRQTRQVESQAAPCPCLPQGPFGPCVAVLKLTQLGSHLQVAIGINRKSLIGFSCLDFLSTRQVLPRGKIHKGTRL